MIEEENYAEQLSDCPNYYEFVNDRNNIPNKALSLIGDSGCSCRNDIAVTNFPDFGSFTFSFWIKYSQLSNSNNLISIKQTLDYSEENLIFVLYNNVITYYYPSNEEGFDINTSGLLNTWFHVAFVRNISDNTLKAYINGVEISSKTDHTNGNYTPVVFSIGGDSQYTTSCGKNAYIDDFRIYSRALTAVDIPQLLVSTQKIFFSSCTDASKDTSEFLDYTFDSSDFCVENTCVDSIQSIQQTVTIPNQASVDKILKLKDILGYDKNCFDLYTKLSTDTVGPGDLNILKVSTIEGCTSPCDVDFIFSFEGTSHTLFKTQVPISFTRTSSTVLTNLSSTGSPTFPQYSRQHAITTNLENFSRTLGTFEARKESDYSTPTSNDPSFREYVYYVFTTEQAGLNLTKSDVTVKLIHPTGNNTLFTLDPSDFELENGSVADSYNLRLKAKAIGEYKVVVEMTSN